MRKLRWALMPFAAGLLALAVACSGGDDSSDDDGAATGASSASGGGGAVSQELDLAQAANRLLELRSFRFDMSLSLDLDLEALELSGTGDDGDQFGAAMAAMFLALFQDVSISGAYVAPDSFDLEASFAGETARYIQIDNEAWENDGSGWTETTPNGGDLSFLGDPTQFSVDMLPDAVLRNAEISEEEVNGQSATRYHFDKASLEAMAAELGEDVSEFGEIDELTLDVWLVDGSLPVKFEIVASFSDPESVATSA